jgi:hypothetical protein
MRPMMICLIVLGSVFAVHSHVSASGSTLMIINFAQQTNAPLRINSLAQTLTDAVSSVEVKNYSGKAIQSYQIGWIQTLPNGCAAASMKAAITNGPVEEVSVEPSATATTGSYRVWMKDLLATAKKHEAKLLYVQVGVMSVKFADGTTWNYGPAEEGLFDTAERNALSAKCTSGRVAYPFALHQNSATPRLDFAGAALFGF